MTRMDTKQMFWAKRLDNKDWTQGYLFKSWDRAYILWGMTNDAPNMIEVDPESILSTKPVEKELAEKLYQGFYAALIYGSTGVWGDLLESQRAAWRAVASVAEEHFKGKP